MVNEIYKNDILSQKVLHINVMTGSYRVVMDLAWVITIGVVPSQDDDPLLKQELDE